MGSVSTIALDAMGGDHGPGVVVAAALRFLASSERVDLILVGDEAKIAEHLGNADRSRLKIRPTTQEVAMDESPSKALRGKKDSSMRVAIDLVKSGDADACVSAGNTGALMATCISPARKRIISPLAAPPAITLPAKRWLYSAGSP